MISAACAGGCRLAGNSGAWLLIGGGALGCLSAGLLLAWPTTLAFAEFASRWWLALWLLLVIVVMTWLAVAAALRAIRAFRDRAGAARFLSLSAACFGLGLIEASAALGIFTLAMVLAEVPG
jgi:hypothetical protein